MAKFVLVVAICLVAFAFASAQESDNADNVAFGNPKDMAGPGKVFCTKEYSPVCGSDGKTYGNKCEFDNAKRVKADLTFRVGACDELTM